jgi:class 3 adenylate cyclase
MADTLEANPWGVRARRRVVSRGPRLLWGPVCAVLIRELAPFRGREVKSLGDGFLATFDGPARAIHCATLIITALRSLGLQIRAGIHTGEVEIAGDDIRGIAVHITSRVASLGGTDDIVVSRTIKDIVAGSGITF